MKNIKSSYTIILFCFFSILLFTGFNMNNISHKDKTTENELNTSDHHEKKLRHVVLFKFKEGVSQENINMVEEAFGALPGKIPEIKDFEWGLNNSPEGLDKGFTHCFFLTFDNEEGRAVYLPHPDHKAFGNLLGPYLADVLVVDYWIKD